MDGGEQADKDTDSEDNIPIVVRFCVKRRVEDSTADVPRTPQTKRLKAVTTETLEKMGLVTESAKKRRAGGDLSPMKVYKKQRSRRSLSQSQDTQEPDTQSVSDIQASPLMDPQEPGAQSVPDIQQIEVEGTDAAAQGTSPDKAANTDEQTVPVATAIPDEGANPDEGATHDGKTYTDEATNTDAASTAVEEATQEPFTQSVKEGQAPQEPPAQRVGESLNEAESGAIPDVTERVIPDAATHANTNGPIPANADEAGEPEESNDSSGTINWVELQLNADAAAAINLDLDKVHGIPGNTKHGEPDSPRELLRKDQWMNGWRSSSQTISFEQGLGHLKHDVQAIESEELKAHLKTTGILFKSVQYEFSKLNEKVGGIKQHVDSSLGGMITKT